MQPVRITFFALITGLIISGCAPVERRPDMRQNPSALTGSWQVEDIDQGGVIDYSMITLQFDPENRISGSTGCNQYSAAVNTEKNTFQASKTVTTRIACAAAIAMQEQRFLSALDDATHYEIVSDTWLVIYDKEDNPRLKLIPVYTRPQAHRSGFDQSIGQVETFNCAAAGILSMRFLGPETIELTSGKDIAVLNLSRSASGALYRGENMQFWNKGSESSLSMGDREFHCTRQEK